MCFLFLSILKETVIFYILIYLMTVPLSILRTDDSLFVIALSLLSCKVQTLNMTSIVWVQCSSWLMVTCVSSQRHTCTGQIESYCLLESVEKLIHLHCITQIWTIVWVIFTGAMFWIIACKMSFPSSNPSTCEYNYWRTEGMKSTHQTERMSCDQKRRQTAPYSE